MQELSTKKDLNIGLNPFIDLYLSQSKVCSLLKSWPDFHKLEVFVTIEAHLRRSSFVNCINLEG